MGRDAGNCSSTVNGGLRVSCMETQNVDNRGRHLLFDLISNPLYKIGLAQIWKVPAGEFP